MTSFLSNRLPKRDAILSVFAVIAFLAYGRSLYVFVYKVPSWLTFQTLGEILSTLAYGLAWNLLESLFILFLLLVVALILPARWFRDVFVVRGTWFVLVMLAAVLLFFKRYAALGSATLSLLPMWMGVGLGLSVLVAFFATRIRFLSTAAGWLADRLTVFLFLFVPASLISVIVVLLRNIF